MSPSHKQSEENYEYFYDNIKKELSQEGGFHKVTEAKILDRFLDKKLINIKYHKDMLQGAIIHDKSDDKYDMLSSLLITAKYNAFLLDCLYSSK